LDERGLNLVENELQGESPLPDGWTEASVSEIAELLRGVSYKKAVARDTPQDGYAPILRATNIQNDSLVLDSDLVYVPEEHVKPEQKLQVGDIVICMSSGSKHLVGKTGQLSREWMGSFGAFCAAARFHELLDQRFVGCFFGSTRYRNLIRERSSGVNINNLRRGDIETLLFPIPPLAEQRRIAAEIETQFTRLDAGVAALERVRANLRRYRAAALKAACEGWLVPTEAELACAEGRDYESADQLLNRILAERRGRWEADYLDKQRAKGKVPKDDLWRRKYKQPIVPDMEGLPELPEGWVVASMDQLTSLITSGPRHWSKYYDRGSGVFLMAQNVRPGELDLSYRQLVDPPLDDSSRERSQVRKGDLLVTIVGANTGDVCKVPRELPEHYICQSIALMRPVDVELSEFVTLYMVSPENGQRQYRRYIYGAGRPHLKFEEMRMTAILLPSLAEQRRIVAEVERRLSVVEALEREVEAALARAQRLRQAVLKKAFEGRLVAQDPDDEPASALLERIRAAREARAAGGKKRKTRQMQLPTM